jgi:uncharacterized membrane protein
MQALTRLATLWAAGFVVFTVLDLVWIGVVAAPVYRSEVGSLLVLGEGMKSSRILAAMLTWLLITLSVICFVLPRTSESVASALGLGGLMGLVIYGVYDLTNYAVLRGWTLKVTLLDIAWGVFACGVLSALLSGLDRWLFNRVQGMP